jgi:hypothetical protein
MSIGTALFACFVCGFMIYCAFAYKDDERQREWAYKDKRRAIRKQFERRMEQLRERYGEDFATVKEEGK